MENSINWQTLTESLFKKQQTIWRMGIWEFSSKINYFFAVLFDLSVFEPALDFYGGVSLPDSFHFGVLGSGLPEAAHFGVSFPFLGVSGSDPFFPLGGFLSPFLSPFLSLFELLTLLASSSILTDLFPLPPFPFFVGLSPPVLYPLSFHSSSFYFSLYSFCQASSPIALHQFHSWSSWAFYFLYFFSNLVKHRAANSKESSLYGSPYLHS